MKRELVSMLAGLGLLAGSAAVAQPEDAAEHAHESGSLGVLVMAHGGTEDWNGEVREMLAPVAEDAPLEIAFGMADAVSLQEAVDDLEVQGVDRIAVVRLFVSGESWYERTEQILGIAPGAPNRMAAASEHGAHAAQDEDDGGEGEAAAHGGHAIPGMRMEFWRLDADASFAMSTEGLSEAPEAGAVLAERALALSTDPQVESVLILAHGPEDDAENERWIENIDARAEAVRQAAPFRQVAVQTLREDWPEKRAVSEELIRAFVSEASAEDGQVIVIPYRVQGFGPYAEVLEGLSYVSDGKGLLPSAEIEHWVRRQVEELRTAEFRAPLAAEEMRQAHEASAEHQHAPRID
ncbi:MAG: CbiX/SirB N-terminal domain-containing protein [Maricaulaceae bacterium]|jgi:hypothetical protein